MFSLNLISFLNTSITAVTINLFASEIRGEVKCVRSVCRPHKALSLSYRSVLFASLRW